MYGKQKRKKEREKREPKFMDGQMDKVSYRVDIQWSRDEKKDVIN